MKILSTLEVYEKVRAHLLSQMERAVVPSAYRMKDMSGAQCMYRTQEGLSCAIGCLIDDEHYIPVLEGCGIDELVLDELVLDEISDLRTALHKSGVDITINDMVSLLGALQRTHDTLPPKDWEKELDRLKTKYF